MRLIDRSVGIEQRIFFISGPCVIESLETALRTGERIASIAKKLDTLFIYKSSYYKANRTSATAYRGPGLQDGLNVLQRVKSEFGLAITTDVHSVDDIQAAKDVVDLLQIPALLSRQTDLIEAASRAHRPVNFKKGQFMSPEETGCMVEKARIAASAAGQSTEKFLISERGTSFGYQRLVADMRALEVMRATRCPIIFDASHSVQEPAALGIESGGERRHIPALARAAVAVGVSGIFIETHPSPSEAKCDRMTQWPLDEIERLAEELLFLDLIVKQKKTIDSKSWST